MSGQMFICSFSGPAAELPRKKRNPDGVLAALSKHPRVSTWDMSENAWLWKACKDLEERGLIMAMDEQYPWHRYAVTEAGRAALSEMEKRHACA